MTQCGQVYPVWVSLGWVKWQGVSGREPLMSIEYHRCKCQGVRVTRWGFTAVLCTEHGASPPIGEEK